ncbi:hypothetical protein [Desulfosediminicola flagellatus]|uniref:hypothetical protein n=1 Tax=Desulfosediminicola flagellatus TaxID=2569541 RepID=UPI0010AB9C4D|nr:hypothetical protein [Desulfosediminicola flagellatus]
MRNYEKEKTQTYCRVYGQSEIVKEFETHLIMVGKWKTELLERMPDLFASKSDNADHYSDKEKDQLERKVGQLTMEMDFLEKMCKQLGIPLKGLNK